MITCTEGVKIRGIGFQTAMSMMRELGWVIHGGSILSKEEWPGIKKGGMLIVTATPDLRVTRNGISKSVTEWNEALIALNKGSHDKRERRTDNLTRSP